MDLGFFFFLLSNTARVSNTHVSKENKTPRQKKQTINDHHAEQNEVKKKKKQKNETAKAAKVVIFFFFFWLLPMRWQSLSIYGRCITRTMLIGFFFSLSLSLST